MIVFYIILAVLLKCFAWRQFVIIGWDAPFPCEREKYICRFIILECISAIITAYLAYLIFNYSWLWGILIGVFVIWGIELILGRLYFGMVYSLIYGFYSTSLGQQLLLKRTKGLVQSYNKFLEEKLTDEEKKERKEWLDTLKNK